MLISRIIAQCPKNSKHLCQDFNLNQDQLQKGFLLPHGVAFEPYQKAFQYKVLNSVLFTNKKLNIHYVKRIRNPFLSHLFRRQTHQAGLEGISILLLHIDKRIRLSDLTRRYYRNIIYKLPFTGLFDTDR